MGLFGRKNKGRSGLLTATISARGGSWEVIWIGDGIREPPEFAAGSLTEAAEQAAAYALSVYRPDLGLPDSELQLVIFPWPDGDSRGPIYDVEGGAGAFSASDAMGLGADVRAATLEDLTAAIARQPGGSDAMLQWTRPFADLSPADLGGGP